MFENKKPFFSIIVPVFNNASAIEKAIQSVLVHTNVTLELLVMDAGSTDGTTELLRQVRDKRLKVVCEPDYGVYDAINKAIQRSTGRWIYVLGSDDVLICSLLSIKKYLKSTRTIYYGDVIMNKERYDGPFDWEKLIHKNICHQAIFFPKKLYKNQQFELKYPIYADYAFNLKNWYNPRFKWVYIPELIAEFAVGGLSSTQNDPQFFKDLPSLKNRYIHRRKGWRGKIRSWFDL